MKIEFTTRPDGGSNDVIFLEIRQRMKGIPSYDVYIYDHFEHQYRVATSEKGLEIQDILGNVFHEALDCDFEMEFDVMGIGNNGPKFEDSKAGELMRRIDSAKTERGEGLKL